MSEPQARWSEDGYADVVSAHRDNGQFEVDFANGDSVLLSAGRFGITDPFTVEPDEDGLGVVFRGAGSELTVSWSQLRAASDPGFAHELRRRDSEESKRIGLRLRALREDRNLNQRDVASLVGMTPPQLSKIENGTTDLRLSTLQSLLRAMGATIADITGPDVPETSRRVIELQAAKAGAPRDLVKRLLEGLPRKRTADVIRRAFGWELPELANGAPSRVPIDAAIAFKTARPFEPRDSTPTIHLAQTAGEITSAAMVSPVPASGFNPDPVTLRAEALAGRSQLTLPILAEWAWQHGTPVLPLHGKGGFAAAVLRNADRPVIVLKESRELAVFWLFDLAHEIGHLSLGHVGTEGIVDLDSPSAFTRVDSIESAADAFALSLLIPNHSELLTEIRQRTRGNYLRFKTAVADAAAAAGVSAGLLGIVAAYEMTDIGEYKDRWGSASNLARLDGVGYETVAALARRNVTFESLGDTDRELMQQLLSAQ